jgi:hypothetical protein
MVGCLWFVGSGARGSQMQRAGGPNSHVVNHGEEEWVPKACRDGKHGDRSPLDEQNKLVHYLGSEMERLLVGTLEEIPIGP